MSEPQIEARLVEALQPIRGFCLAAMIQHLFASGIYDVLASDGAIRPEDFARQRRYDPLRLDAMFRFLTNEDVLVEQDGTFQLSLHGRSLGQFRAWYEMLIGGYGATFLDLGNRLALGSGPAPRDGARVGSGSCGISLFDSIPIVRRLIERMGRPCRVLLDLGCGSGIYLTEICKALPECRGFGIDPDSGAYAEALASVARQGMSERIEVQQADALSFLEKMTIEPDVVLLGFVAHEVLGQEGEAGVIRLLDMLFRHAPRSHLIIIDVDYRHDDFGIMRHALAQAYYNAWYVLHPFTGQYVQREAFWDSLFGRAGLQIVAKETTDRGVDSTGLELGWLLRRARVAG